MKWRDYETQVYTEFCTKYPGHQILFDQKIDGRYSKVPRQIDVLVKTDAAGVKLIGTFDCKCFNEKVDVKIIDSMFGFMNDVGANFGGVVTTMGFSYGAKNRADSARIDIRVIPFISPAEVVDHFVPRADFSYPRNSMHAAII